MKRGKQEKRGKPGPKDAAPAPEEVHVTIEEEAPAEPAPEESLSVEILEERAARAEEYFERLQRLQAEFENYRKRVQRDKADTQRWANEGLIAELLPVLDNFERALSASSTGSVEALRTGIEMVRKEMKKVLSSFGLEEIQAVGCPFDPELYEAIETVDRPDLPENTVVEERLRGYTLGGRLLRPAVVAVSKGGPPEEAEPSAIRE